MLVYPTGLRGIDDDLDAGGFPAGSILSFEYPPGSAAENVLWTFLARGLNENGREPREADEVARPSSIHYLTTGKRRDKIEQGLLTHRPRDEEGDLGVDVQYHEIDPLDAMGQGDGEVKLPFFEGIEGDNPAFVVDSMSDLVEFLEPAAYQQLFNAIREKVESQDGIAFLTFGREGRSWLPGETYLLDRCDGHIRYESEEGTSNDLLWIDNLRGAMGPRAGFPARWTLDISDIVRIDSSESD